MSWFVLARALFIGAVTSAAFFLRPVTGDPLLSLALGGVAVLNINELANALKPVVLPGEIMKVFILKEGKEYNPVSYTHLTLPTKA